MVATPPEKKIATWLEEDDQKPLLNASGKHANTPDDSGAQKKVQLDGRSPTQWLVDELKDGAAKGKSKGWFYDQSSALIKVIRTSVGHNFLTKRSSGCGQRHRFWKTTMCFLG